jgi:hypothetical protein
MIGFNLNYENKIIVKKNKNHNYFLAHQSRVLESLK